MSATVVKSTRKRKRLICNVHDEIVDIAEDLDDELEDRGIPKSLRKKLGKIIELATEAKEYGQSMEDRLNIYRLGIEDMGFTRDN